MNLDYCIEIFMDLKNRIKEEVNVGQWVQLVEDVLEAVDVDQGKEEFLRGMKQVTDKYHI